MTPGRRRHAADLDTLDPRMDPGSGTTASSPYAAYAAPRARVLEPDLARPPLATTGQRLANFVLDSLGSLVFYVLLVFCVTFALLVYDPPLLQNVVTPAFDSPLTVLAFFLVYYFGFEYGCGATPAKWLTGTRVERVDGRPAGPGALLGRSLSRFLPFDAFSFLGSDGTPLGWHDRLSRTVVVQHRVRERRAPTSSGPFL